MSTGEPEEVIIGGAPPELKGYSFARRRLPEFGGLNSVPSGDNGRDASMRIVGGALLVAGAMAGGVAAAHEGFGDAVATVEGNTVQTIEGALDLAGKLVPDNEPNRPRIPNYIMLGDVEITLSDELNFRNSPHVTRKEDRSNKLDWKLANKIVVDGKVEYQPVEVNKDGRIIVHNPEFVVGQYTEGGYGTGDDQERLWMQLYRTDGTTGFVAYQGETRQYIKELKHDPTQRTTFIKAETLQDAGGIRVVKYDQPVPTQTSFITSPPRE